MPLPLPNLDDRTYDEILAEAMARIPLIYEDWTNHNPSDPGVMLLELFAWLTELSLYRVNQIPEENYRTFLQLLSDTPQLNDETLDQSIHRVITDLRTPYRAITASDYEELAITQWKAEGMSRVARASCFPRLNLEHPNPDELFNPIAGHVSLVVVPESEQSYPKPSDEMLDSLYDFFLPRRTLTTRHHVVAPTYVYFIIHAFAAIYDDYRIEDVEQEIGNRIYQYLHPIYGGDDGKGYEFGRNVFISEMIQIADGVEGVDYIENLQIIPRYRKDLARLFTYPQQPERRIGLALNPIDLPAFLDIKLLSPKKDDS